MRNPLPFDTHAYVKRLTAAGVPEAQAEVHADALSEIALAQLATKEDLRQAVEELRNEIHTQVQGVRGEIQGVRGEIQAVRGETQAVRGEIRESELRVVARLESELRKQMIWIIGIMLAYGGALVAFVKLLISPR